MDQSEKDKQVQEQLESRTCTNCGCTFLALKTETSYDCPECSSNRWFRTGEKYKQAKYPKK